MPDAEGRSRPVPVTVVCMLFALALAVVVLRVLTGWSAFMALGSGARIGTVAAILTLSATLVAYWRMRRWGAWLIAAVLGARLAAGGADLLPLRLEDVVLPLALVLVGLAYYREMR